VDTKRSHVIQNQQYFTIYILQLIDTTNNAAKANEILIQLNFWIFLIELVLEVQFLFPAAMYNRKILTTLCLDHDVK
jgi:hypothetical protein